MLMLLFVHLLLAKLANPVGLQLLPRSYFLVIEFRIIPTRQVGYFGTVSPLQAHSRLLNIMSKDGQNGLLFPLTHLTFTFSL